MVHLGPEAQDRRNVQPRFEYFNNEAVQERRRTPAVLQLEIKRRKLVPLAGPAFTTDPRNSVLFGFNVWAISGV
jgi:hypothetical protein